MSSDADYMSFLDKANAPTGAAKQAHGQSTGDFKAVDTAVPEELQVAVQDAYYASDADEPFAAVSLGWEEGGLPDEGE